MPRRKNKSKKDRDNVANGDDDGDDNNVTNMDNIEVEEKTLNELIDDLTEKRSSTRIKTLRSLLEKLTQFYCLDELQSYSETLIYNLTLCMKKGSSKEKTLSLIVWTASILTFGVDGENILRGPSDYILAILRDTKVPNTVRATAASCISLATFIASQQPEFTANVVSIFVHLLGKTKVKDADSGEFLAAVIRGWILLMTTLRRTQLRKMDINVRMRQMINFLESTSSDVRNGAGECIAFLYEEIVNNDDGTDLDPFKVNWHEITAKLRALSTDSSKRQGKKDRRLQRSIFREVVRTIEDCDSPTSDMVIGTEKHTFVGWSKLRQLDAFRSICGTGLMHHMTDNPLLSDVFDVDFTIGHKPISLTDKKIMKRDQYAASKHNERLRNERDKKKRADKRAHIYVEN